MCVFLCVCVCVVVRGTIVGGNLLGLNSLSNFSDSFVLPASRDPMLTCIVWPRYSQKNHRNHDSHGIKIPPPVYIMNGIFIECRAFDRTLDEMCVNRTRCDHRKNYEWFIRCLRLSSAPTGNLVVRVKRPAWLQCWTDSDFHFIVPRHNEKLRMETTEVRTESIPSGNVRPGY